MQHLSEEKKNQSLFTGAQFNLDRVGTFNVGSRDENGVFYKMCKTKTFLFMVCGLEGGEEREGKKRGGRQQRQAEGGGGRMRKRKCHEI